MYFEFINQRHSEFCPPEHETGEVAVESLVPGDEFVAERQSRHQTALLQPEDGRETAREEYALHGGKRDHTLGVGGLK